MKTNIELERAFCAAKKAVVTAILVVAAGLAANAQDTNRFQGTGNAGLGTTTPTLQSGITNTILEVKGTVNPGVAVTSTASGGRQYFVYSSQTDPGYFGVFDATAGADRFVINNSGNVGIGTSIPGNYKLNVNGPLAGRATFTSYDPDGLFGATALPSRIGTPNFNGGILFGYEDLGLGDYSPRLGFQQTNHATHSPNITSTQASIGLVRNGNITIKGGASNTEFLRIDNSGNVGIGTTAPQSNLQIGSQTASATGTPTTLSLGGSFSSAAGANLKLKLYDDGVVGNTYGIGVSSGSMDFGVHSTAGYKWYAGGANKMTLTSAGDLSVSGTINARYQDLAEWVPSSEHLSAGTVVVLDTSKSNQVISSTLGYDTRVAGVISAQPGISLGESGEGKVLVATTGRVKVKVDASRGPIQIGDLLVTSDVAGVAMKSEPVEFAGRKMHMPGTIIGKALEPLAKGSGEILVLLSLQ